MKIHIVSLPRTGSTMMYKGLAKILPENGQRFREPFNDAMPQNDIPKLIQQVNCAEHYLIKSHFRHLDGLAPNDLQLLIHDDTDWIRLIRRYIVRAVLSYMVAEHSKKWIYNVGEDYIMETFEADITTFVVYLMEYIKMTKDLVRNKLNLPFKLNLVYENLSMKQIFDFYGHDELLLDTIEGPHPNHIIENYFTLIKIGNEIADQEFADDPNIDCHNGKIINVNFVDSY